MPRNKKPFQPKDLDPTLAAIEPRSNMELKNLSHNPSFSEETHCFRASVYINGKRMFSVSNRGNGESNYYEPLAHGGLDHHLLEKGREEFGEAMALAREEAKQYTLKKIDMGEDLQWAIDRFGNGESNELIDWLISDLINEQLTLKEMRKVLKKKVAIYEPKHNAISVFTTQPTDENIEALRSRHHTDETNEGWVWLNVIPEPEAYKYWRVAA